MTITVTSKAFTDGETIPVRYTCEGENISPALAWAHVPAETKSLAIIVDDPDASKVWTHWVVYNLPPDAEGIPEHQPKTPTLPDGAHQGLNDSHEIGYDGPCPPPGPIHHYRFTVYALDTGFTLKDPVRKSDLLNAMKGHILAQGTLVGLCKR